MIYKTAENVFNVYIPKWALSNDAKMDIIIVNNINWNVMCQRQTILSNTPKHVGAATGSVYMRSLLLLLSIKFALLQWHFDRANQTGLCLLSLTMCHIVSQCNFIALEKSVVRDEYNAPYITIKPMTFSIAMFSWHFIHCLVFKKMRGTRHSLNKPSVGRSHSCERVLSVCIHAYFFRYEMPNQKETHHQVECHDL